ncbi:hypothetical protein FB451DRAFT_1188714 [Mycena latifolia]|nr:hypothetical protein FB451DRAFT_1188714 [Mycena latifolia]
MTDLSGKRGSGRGVSYRGDVTHLECRVPISTRQESGASTESAEWTNQITFRGHGRRLGEWIYGGGTRKEVALFEVREDRGALNDSRQSSGKKLQPSPGLSPSPQRRAQDSSKPKPDPTLTTLVEEPGQGPSPNPNTALRAVIIRDVSVSLDGGGEWAQKPKYLNVDDKDGGMSDCAQRHSFRLRRVQLHVKTTRIVAPSSPQRCVDVEASVASRGAHRTFPIWRRIRANTPESDNSVQSTWLDTDGVGERSHQNTEEANVPINLLKCWIALDSAAELHGGVRRGGLDMYEMQHRRSAGRTYCNINEAHKSGVPRETRGRHHRRTQNGSIW